jgi:8-oxo-dGTP pyrophosphatase MutT (NUDIX family)
VSTGQWRLLSAEAVIETPWLKILKKHYQRANDPVPREFITVDRPDFVVIVAAHGDHIVFVRQYRHGTDADYWALPGGFLEANEGVIAAAARELLEETGMVGERFSVIGALHPLPGYVRSVCYVVVCDIASDDHQRGDEVDELRLISRSEAHRLIREGAIVEMQAVSAILMRG